MLLLNRVRKAISASQVGLEPHSWTLPSPSSYPTPKPGGKLQTVIPNPKIFANAHIPGHIEYNTEKNLSSTLTSATPLSTSPCSSVSTTSASAPPRSSLTAPCL
uniref:Uncharacterized protein n=1 Tax=Bionectria ochroleuca TaxID=29856 RepID=A0A8H7NH24_BIOOC